MKNEAGVWIEKQRKVTEPAPLNKQWSVEEKESILDYLLGEVEPDEVKACCYYEYGRASETLRKARREYNPADPDNSSLTISYYFPALGIGRTTLLFFALQQFP
jgi:hypothetical protein